MPGDNTIAQTEGSGKNVRTFERSIGSTLTQEQLVILGEPSLAGYAVVTAAISTATGNSHLLALMNGTTNKLRIMDVELDQAGFANTQTFMRVDLLRLTTPSNAGTALTINPLDPSDAATGATAQSLPSIKGTEGALMWTDYAFMAGGASASTAQPAPIAERQFGNPRFKPIIIAAGSTNGIVVKNVTAVPGGTVTVGIIYEESNF